MCKSAQPGSKEPAGNKRFARSRYASLRAFVCTTEQSRRVRAGVGVGWVFNEQGKPKGYALNRGWVFSLGDSPGASPKPRPSSAPAVLLSRSAPVALSLLPARRLPKRHRHGGTYRSRKRFGPFWLTRRRERLQFMSPRFRVAVTTSHEHLLQSDGFLLERLVGSTIWEVAAPQPRPWQFPKSL